MEEVRPQRVGDGGESSNVKILTKRKYIFNLNEKAKDNCTTADILFTPNTGTTH